MSFSTNSTITMTDFSAKTLDRLSIRDRILGFDRFASPDKHTINTDIVIFISHKISTVSEWYLENGKSIKLTPDQLVLGRILDSSRAAWNAAGEYGVGATVQVFCGYQSPGRSSYFTETSIVKIQAATQEEVYFIDTMYKNFIVNSVAVKTTY